MYLRRLFKIFLIYLRKSERWRESRGTGRRGRSRLPDEQGVPGGARSQDPKIMT